MILEWPVRTFIGIDLFICLSPPCSSFSCRCAGKKQLSSDDHRCVVDRAGWCSVLLKARVLCPHHPRQMTPECRRIGFDVPLLAAVTRQAKARLMLGRYAKLWPADSQGTSLVNCHYLAFVLYAHLCWFMAIFNCFFAPVTGFCPVSETSNPRYGRGQSCHTGFAASVIEYWTPNKHC